MAARVQQLEQENAQLREALASRIVIEQAKGILAERNRISLDEAFELLRRAARSNRMRIHTLAAAVVAACTTPNEPDPVSLHVVLGERAEAVDDGPNDLR